MRVFHNILACAVLLLLATGIAAAQEYPERRLVRDGNRQFKQLNYRNSLNRYNEALEHDTMKYESLYNRANAYLQYMFSNPQDSTLNGEVANSYYEQIAADKLLSAEQRAEVLRNLGEGLFLQQNYEAALNSFRESLKLNPADRETKYNYILTKRIVDQKRNQQQQNQDQNQQNDQNQNQQNQDQNQQNQDQNQDQQNNDDQNNQDNQDNQNDQNDQNKPDDGDDNKDGDNEPDENPEGDNDDQNNGDQEGDNDEREGEAPPPSGISREEQERMLDAIQAQEDKTNEKLKEGEKAYIIPGKKNW